MSLTCVECGAGNADGRAFCTGCGVSLALATASGPAAVPVAAAPRNAFPEEPGRVSWGSGALSWVLVAVLVLLVAAMAGTGRWAFQRTSEPAEPVPMTIVDPAPQAEDATMDAAADTARPAEETVVAEPPLPMAPPRGGARPVGPVGGGPASACYGRSGTLLDTCIRTQCLQPHYRNHPACRGD